MIRGLIRTKGVRMIPYNLPHPMSIYDNMVKGGMLDDMKGFVLESYNASSNERISSFMWVGR